MPRLRVVLPLVLVFGGCLARNRPNADRPFSFSRDEEVQGVALARQYVEKQGISPKEAVFKIDEQRTGDSSGKASHRQMIVTAEFKDREPWRLLVMPDGSVKRIEEQATAGESQPTTTPTDPQ